MSIDRYDSEGTRRGEPEVRYAFVGAGIGLLLIYLGMRIPLRILRWSVIGIGILFVVVMTAYIVELVWTRLSSRLRRRLNTVRGHIRTDPQLGTLTRDLTTHCWLTTLTIGNRRVNLAIAGDEDPDPILLTRAHDLAADLQTLDRRLREYLAREEREWALESPDLAKEIAQLHVSGIVLRSPDGPIVMDFTGPDEMKYWYCNYVDGEAGGLRFDT